MTGKAPQSSIQLRIDDNVRRQAEEIFNSLGTNLNDAVRIFVYMSVKSGGFPFSINDSSYQRKSEHNYTVTSLPKD